MSIKSVKMKILRKKMCFFLMSQGSFNTKIRFLSQKMWPVARAQTDGQTDRVITVGTLSGFQDFFLSSRIGPISINTMEPCWFLELQIDTRGRFKNFYWKSCQIANSKSLTRINITHKWNFRFSFKMMFYVQFHVPVRWFRI